MTDTGSTLLLGAITYNQVSSAEVLLKYGNADPNVVDSHNQTALMYCVLHARANLSIMKLLTKYGFDYAKLVNTRENKTGNTVFLCLCNREYTDDPIPCLKYLFQIGKKIPNCSINTLATNERGMCGLHVAIAESNIDLVRYVLENEYFPNNDKPNPDGMAFINMNLMGGKLSLAYFVCGSMYHQKYYDGKRHLAIFKLLLSYGMKVNFINVPTTPLSHAIYSQYVEIVRYMLDENLCPIRTFVNLFEQMYSPDRKSVNNKIWEALYNYGINHNLIVQDLQHDALIVRAATINLSTFKAVVSIILTHHGINDLKQYNQCVNTNTRVLKGVAQVPYIKQDVKMFINALINGDNTTSVQVEVTCGKNHKTKNSNNKKISNSKQMCSVCGDNRDGSQMLCGFKCDECNSFICNDCVMVQKISKEIDMIDNQNVNVKPLPNVCTNSAEYESSIVREVFQHKDNKTLMNKAKSFIFVLFFFNLVFELYT